MVKMLSPPRSPISSSFHSSEILEYNYSREDASAQAAKARIRAYVEKKKKKEEAERKMELETRWYRQQKGRKKVRNGQELALKRSRAYRAKQERKERRQRRAEAKDKWYLKTGDPPVKNGRDIAARSASVYIRSQRKKLEEEARAEAERKTRIAEAQARIQQIANKNARRSRYPKGSRKEIEAEAQLRFNGECARSSGFAPGPYLNGGNSTKNRKMVRTFGNFLTNAVDPREYGPENY